jgi:hypothetical protein
VIPEPENRLVALGQRHTSTWCAAASRSTPSGCARRHPLAALHRPPSRTGHRGETGVNIAPAIDDDHRGGSGQTPPPRTLCPFHPADALLVSLSSSGLNSVGRQFATVLRRHTIWLHRHSDRGTAISRRRSVRIPTKAATYSNRIAATIPT